MSHPITVNLDLKSCPCGCLYMIPVWLGSWECPACARRSLDRSERGRLDALEASARSDRTIAALRGALTRARNRSKAARATGATTQEET